MIDNKITVLCLPVLLIAALFFPLEAVSASEYEVTPSHTKTVMITSSTQTDVAFELFTVDKWGKLLYNFTCSDKSGLDVMIDFWTVQLTEAIQADAGDLGHEYLLSCMAFPVVDSCKCEKYRVEDDKLPVTIYYEANKIRNPDHNLKEGATLTLTAKYYNLTGEEATNGASLPGFALALLTFGTLAIAARRRPRF